MVGRDGRYLAVDTEKHVSLKFRSRVGNTPDYEFVGWEPQATGVVSNTAQAVVSSAQPTTKEDNLIEKALSPFLDKTDTASLKVGSLAKLKDDHLPSDFSTSTDGAKNVAPVTAWVKSIK